ncbi:GntR family transcriptional regulator [Granulicella sp. L60]|uniref:GntR family transcriptional regulator n=1 Tax=Granulicella sp. L60 TaxID=1641866 RepID=UPI00131EAFDF|nr:GntR family transcriptional regulator [Granulicella sp. L60]
MIPTARAETSERVPTGSSQIASAERLLNRNGFVPLYFQIQRALVDKINSGELREGDLLSSEWNLARAYRVSRMTAREALHGLKASGYACSLRGRGTFVTKPKLDKPQAQLRGFTEEITRRGMVPASRLLEQAVIDADVELAESLEVQVGTPVMRLYRLRLADGIPMAVQKAYLSLSRFSGIERINFTEQSLYQTLREEFSVQAAWAAETIEILPATREESRLLEIPTRTGILSISRNTITEDRVPIEITVSRYRADRYRALVYIPATAIPVDATIYKNNSLRLQNNSEAL